MKKRIRAFRKTNARVQSSFCCQPLTSNPSLKRWMETQLMSFFVTKYFLRCSACHAAKLKNTVVLMMAIHSARVFALSGGSTHRHVPRPHKWGQHGQGNTQPNQQILCTEENC